MKRYTWTWQRILTYGVSVLVAMVFIVMGGSKFNPEGAWTASFEQWGYPVWFRYSIGGLETVGGFLLLIPQLTSYAACVLIVIMAGAFVTRLGDGLSGDHAGIAVYAALLAWFAYAWWDRRVPLRLGPIRT